MKKLMSVALVAIFSLSTSILMAQPPQGGQGGQGGRGERKQMTVEQRVEQMQEKLKLTDEQCAEITKIMNDSPKAERGDREAMKKVMEEQNEKISEVLNKKQAKKWKKMQQEQRPQGPPPGAPQM